jgi:transposase InsO family protein
MSAFPSRAPSTRSCTGTVWSKASADLVIEPSARRCRPESPPHDLWCADFKGEFKLGNGEYCYPLTVTDHASRYLLLCEALDSTREDTAITAFQQLFLERGLPAAIRSDNGVAFHSPNALFNLSKLSVWWLRLGSRSSVSAPDDRSRTADMSVCPSR